MSLHPAETASRISAAVVAQTATRVFPGTANAVKEQLLAKVQDPSVPSIDGRTLWIVSLAVAGGLPQPGAGPSGANNPRRVASYVLVFLDPSSGQFVFGDAGA
jgi:hypothetical protein